jgi:hypothetical protein
MLLPLEKIWHRVELARSDSDTTLFLHLMYAGEMLVKLVAGGLIAAIADNRERHQYSLLYRLVRADGVGEWAQAIDEALIGPSSQHLLPGTADDRRSLTERVPAGNWQYDVVSSLRSAVEGVTPDMDPLPSRVALWQWFVDFVVLRNKTRAHGATTPAVCANLCPPLERSLTLLIERMPILNRAWAYLHRNLSGKYRVVSIGGDQSAFDVLKTTTGANTLAYRNLSDGVYIAYDDFVRVALIETTVDVSDFFFPNGAFRGRTFELLSYVSDNRKPGDGSLYMAPASDLPPSETEGMGALEVVGQTWTNLPAPPTDYVPRQSLESELYRVLCDDRHPVITLVGRGGIGKTSLALAVLNRVALEGQFEVIVWFIARDIDLLPQGPKIVTPRVLNQADMATEFARLLRPTAMADKGFRPIENLTSALTRSPTGGPILFVFDNFETARSPSDLFSWMDTHIRLPNKILITTRHREFKADFPVEVLGMTEGEASRLMNATARRLNITDLLTTSYLQDIFEEADGHPYIMKILLGEVAKARMLVKVERMVAGREEILDALFERTYAGLQPAAKRVFLTLCSWRSLVPQLALEAVLLRPGNERMDIEGAVDELISSSFVGVAIANDGTTFLDVPLVASVFGIRKLAISPLKAAIDADAEFLHQIGATSTSALRHGVKPRLDKFFENVARRVANGLLPFDAIFPSLEFICRRYPDAWLTLAKLYEELGGVGALANACECIRRFLEQPQQIGDQRSAWEELARLYTAMGDWTGAAQAHIRICELPQTPFSTLSNAASWLNNLLRENYLALDSDEKRVLYRELASLMERRASEADATDLSRLSWLYLHTREVEAALGTAERGLTIDPENEHCQRLVARLTHGVALS